MVPGHSVPGYFGPWSFWLGTFQYLVISALGHFSHRSIGSWVISAQVHAKNILVQGHSPRTFQSLAILGSSSFRFLVIWPKLFWANVISVPGHDSPVILVPGSFQPLFILVILFAGHFCLGSFQSWSFLPLDISALCHFGPELFWPPCHFSHGSFQQQVISILCHLAGSFQSKVISAREILVPGHFAPWSFRSLGHFGVVTFWSQVILTQGHFGPPGTFLSRVILVPGHSVPSHFCSRAFCPVTFWVWVISVPGHFSSELFPSLVISALGHVSPWKFLPGWFNFANLAIYRVKHNVLLLLTQLIFKFCSGLQQQMSFTCHFE